MNKVKRFLLAVAVMLQVTLAPLGLRLRELPRRIRRAHGYRKPVCLPEWRRRLHAGLPPLPVAGGATDTTFGKVRKFEDFLVTAIADLPEIDVLAVAGETSAVVAGAADGRLRLAPAASNDDDISAMSLGALNWTAGDDLYMEARIFLSALTDNKYFVGFGDSIASTDETTFSATTDTITIDTMSDAFGILFDQDATTKVLWCVAGKTDAVTVNKALNAKYNPVADTAITLGCFCSADRQVMEFYVNGESVYRIDSATTLIAAVDLVPIVAAYEQATAFNLDIDYIYAWKNRSTA